MHANDLKMEDDGLGRTSDIWMDARCFHLVCTYPFLVTYMIKVVGVGHYRVVCPHHCWSSLKMVARWCMELDSEVGGLMSKGVMIVFRMGRFFRCGPWIECWMVLSWKWVKQWRAWIHMSRDRWYLKCFCCTKTEQGYCGDTYRYFVRLPRVGWLDPYNLGQLIGSSIQLWAAMHVSSFRLRDTRVQLKIEIYPP